MGSALAVVGLAAGQQPLLDEAACGVSPAESECDRQSQHHGPEGDSESRMNDAAADPELVQGNCRGRHQHQHPEPRAEHLAERTRALTAASSAARQARFETAKPSSRTRMDTRMRGK